MEQDIKVKIPAKMEEACIIYDTGEGSLKVETKSSKGAPILHLNLTRKWFDMIKRGLKFEEYRAIKPFWDRIFNTGKIKIKGKFYDPKDVLICFSNGYNSGRPQMIYSCNGLRTGTGREEWGAEPGEKYYVLSLGEKLT